MKVIDLQEFFPIRYRVLSIVFASLTLMACETASESDQPAAADPAPAAEAVDLQAAAIANALEAAWPGMAEGATVVDWKGNVLREGTNGYTCLPTPPNLVDNAPMCMDAGWMEWAQAWQSKGQYEASGLHISYMLGGDGGASNTDPYAEGPTADNEWIKEGAHLMIIAPAALMDAYSTDPYNGGPYVMWKGTPYAHLMVPIGARDEMPAAAEEPTTAAIANALEAAWPGMASDATVVDWEGSVLKEGSNGYTCLPTPPQLTDNAPMCMDAGWMEWAQAWNAKGPYEAKGLHISYMLGGDGGASNTDPYAEGPTADNEWIKEGAHLMIIAPVEMLAGYPTDPNNGGPYVMWKDTPYAHLMVPIGARE